MEIYQGMRTHHKIQSECGMHAIWHKTGNILPVMVNGRQMGSEKVLVLHTNKNFDHSRKKKNFNQQRTNCMMHQYHLGDLELEKERELVLCKIFYQTNTRARSKKIIS